MAAAPKFQLNSKSIFLTVPQCDYPLSEFHSNIVTFFRNRNIGIAHGVVSRECHQDGNFHLHAAFSLLRPLSTRDARVFDELALKHPNVSGRFTGGVKKAYEYVMKEGNYLPLPDETFSLADFLATKKKDSLAEKIVSLLKERNCLDSLDETHASYLVQNLQKVRLYSNFLELKKRRSEFAMAQETKVFVQPVERYSSVWNRQIAGWLSKNIRQKRAHRQAQMWIKASPGAGKTSLILMLESVFNLSIYYWPRDEKWWDGYSDGAFDLIVLDEYRSQKMITELNPILSGDPTPLSRRNAPPLIKRDILPVLILSNFHPEECYHKVMPSQLAPLLDRIQIVNVPSGEVIRIEKAPESTATLDSPPLLDDLPLGFLEDPLPRSPALSPGLIYDPYSEEWVRQI